MSAGFDAIVVGLGGMGSAAAAHLAKRGRSVLGLERFGPAHDLGSSHGRSRIIRQSYFEDPAYVPLVRRAYELFERLEHDTGVDLLTVTGGLYLGRPESATVAGSRLAAEQWSLPHELMDGAEIPRRFPTIVPPHGHVGLYEPLAGVVRPEATVRAHLAQADAAGADLRFGEEVVDWTTDTGGVTVRTSSDQVHRAERLVITPGAWAPRLLADLGIPFRVERLVQHWFRPRAGITAFVDHPVWIAELDDGRQPYGLPALDGDEGVKVAFFREATPTDPDDVRRSVHPDEVSDIASAVERLVPGLAGTAVDHAVCLYTTSPDEHFVIAPHPGHPRVVVACGFSGHGFKFTPVVGEILADLVIDGSTIHPIGLFGATRFD